MMRIVLDTNCLLMILPRRSPYRIVWDEFLACHIVFCLSNDIMEEYVEKLSEKTSPEVASNVINTILNKKDNVVLVDPRYRFRLIEADPDDNKFTDCAVAAGADLLVSNDSHFRALRSISYPRVKVVDLPSFVGLL